MIMTGEPAMKGKPRKSRGILKAAIAGLAAGAVAGVVIYWPHQEPAPEPAYTGTVVTPQGNGNCRRLVYASDASRLLEATTVRCDSLRSARDDLPPVLRGYQDALGKR